MRIDPIILLLIRSTLGFVFGLSAVAKWRSLGDFTGIVANYRLLPSWAVRPVAWTVPVVESLVSIGFLTGFRSIETVILAETALVAFSLAITVNLLRGRREIDCGCFGPLLRQRIGWWMIGRNVVLMGMALLTLPAVGRPSRLGSSVDFLVGSAAACVLLLVALAFQQVLSRPLSTGARE